VWQHWPLWLAIAAWIQVTPAVAYGASWIVNKEKEGE
jgi:hypothetical protein